MMAKRRHTSEQVLALHAGGELGRWKLFLADRHLSNCAACRQSLAEYRRARHDLAALRETPAVDYKALARQVRAAQTAGAERSANGRRGQWLLAAAACAVAVAGALLFDVPHERPQGPDLTLSGRAMEASWSEAVLGLDASDAEVGAAGELRFRAYDAASGTLSITEYY